MRIATALGLALGLTLTACGGGGAEPADDGHEGTSGGEDLTQYEGPIGSTDLALGQERFEGLCGACHNEGGAPLMDGFGWEVSQMRRQIREGEDEMPPIPVDRLSDDDMEAVLAYMATIGAVTE